MLAKSSRWFSLMVALFVLGSAWIWYSRAPEGANAATGVAPQPGFRAPPFTLERLGGSVASLGDFRGNPLVVNFWATWCHPCRAEMPAIQRVATRYAADGLVVLLVNQGEDPVTIQEYLESIGVTAPVLLDSDFEVSDAYRVRGLPTTFFIDRNGLVRDMAIGGPMSEAYLESKVESLLRVP